MNIIDKYLSVSDNIVTESVGEYPEFDKISKSFWRTLFLGFREQSSLFKYKEYSKESKMISEIVSGVKIIVRAIPQMERNAFVIPGIDASDEKEWMKRAKEWAKANKLYFLNIPPFAFMYLAAIDKLKKMRNYKLVNGKNGKKKFVFSKTDLVINIFVTYGVLQHMDADSRIGIYLHELGHWIDAAKNIPIKMIQDDSEKIFYAHKAMMERVANTRYQEFEADNYAKIAGYGPELIKALDQLIEVRTHATWITRISDNEMAAAVHADNQMEAAKNKWRIDQYPSIQKRKEELEKK